MHSESIIQTRGQYFFYHFMYHLPVRVRTSVKERLAGNISAGVCTCTTVQRLIGNISLQLQSAVVTQSIS